MIDTAQWEGRYILKRVSHDLPRAWCDEEEMALLMTKYESFAFATFSSQKFSFSPHIITC